MKNGKIITSVIVLAFGLFFFTRDARAQTTTGYTSIDYDESTNIVDAYSETDEDYDVDSAYGAFVKLSVVDQNWNTMGFQSASDDGTQGFAAVEIQFSASSGMTYTATGIHRANASQWDYNYDNWPFVTIFYFDFYDFSSFESQNISSPFGYSFLGPGSTVTRSTPLIPLGSTYDQASVSSASSPDHVRVVRDQQGVRCKDPDGLQIRQVTVQIVDANNRTVTHLTWVAESLGDFSTNSCGPVYPVGTECTPADHGGTFIDSMAVSDNVCGFVIPRNSHCGYTLTSTWSVCSGGSNKDIWQYHGETRSDQVKVNGTLKFEPGTYLYAPNITP